MKTFCEIIDDVLDEVAEPLLNGVDKVDREVVTKCYRDHLEALYAEIYKTWPDGDRAFINFIRDSEMFFLNAPAPDKIDMLIYGDLYNRVHSLGMEAFDMAIAYKKTGSLDPLYEINRSKIIDTLSKELSLVEGNQRLTNFIVNELRESVCDLEFASGSTEHISRRLFERFREG